MMKLLLALLLISSVRLFAVEYVSMGQQTSLNLQDPPWLEHGPPNDVTAPGYEYRSRNSTLTTISGTIAFPFGTLPAGTYRLWFKGVSGNPPGGPSANLRYGVNFGTGEVTAAPDDRDGNKYYTDFGIVTVPAPITSLPIRMFRNDSTAIGTSASVVGVCFTTVLDAITTPKDYLQVWNFPTSTDTSAPVPGNYVENGSFEVGVANVSVGGNTSKWFDSDDMWSTDQAHTGTRSLHLNVINCVTPGSSFFVRTKPYLLRPNKAHSAGFWVKASQPNAKFSFRIIPPVEFITGFGLTTRPVYEILNVTVPTTAWTQIKLENKVLIEYPAPTQYAMEIQWAGGTGVKDVYIDDLQLSEGTTLPAYTASYDREIGIGNTKMGGRYYSENNDTTLALRVFNSNPTAQDVAVSYKVDDRKFRQVAAGTITAHAEANSLGVANLDLNSLSLGPFRVTAWINNGSENEMLFSRTHAPRPIAPQASRFGVHNDYYWYSVNGVKQLGWNRLLSPIAVLRWSLVEASPGVFTYNDDLLDRVMASGKSLVGILNSTHAIWANRIYFQISTPTGNFQIGETVTQSPSGFTGIVTWAPTTAHRTGYALMLKSNTGTFVNGQTVVGSTSGASATQISIVSGGSSGTGTIDVGDYVAYTNYVKNVVTHWKDSIKVWELDNEPNMNQQMPKVGPNGPYSYYGQAVKDSVEIINAVCPDCILIGAGGVNDDTTMVNILQGIPAATIPKLSAVSFHFYMGNGEAAGASGGAGLNANDTRAGSGYSACVFAGITNVWNTESGVNCYASFPGFNANWRNMGPAIFPSQDSEPTIREWTASIYKTVYNVMSSIGSNFQKHFMYFSGDTQSYSVSTGSYDVGLTEMDFNECLKPLGVAYRQVAWMLDSTNTWTTGYIQKGTGNSIIRAYGLVDADGRNLVAIRSVLQTVNRVISLPGLTSSDYGVEDIYGEALPFTSGSAQFNDEYIFIVAKPPKLVADLKAAVLAGVLSTTPDITAPNLMMVEYPKVTASPLRRHNVRVRWLSWDNDYISTGNTEGNLFRYRINAGAWSIWSGLTYVELINQPAGPYQVDVEAKDTAGNTSSKSVNFTLP